MINKLGVLLKYYHDKKADLPRQSMITWHNFVVAPWLREPSDLSMSLVFKAFIPSHTIFLHTRHDHMIDTTMKRDVRIEQRCIVTTSPSVPIRRWGEPCGGIMRTTVDEEALSNLYTVCMHIFVDPVFSRCVPCQRVHVHQ